MAKTERQKINAAREKYARQFAQKIKDRDAAIAALAAENEKLRRQIRELEDLRQKDAEVLSSALALAETLSRDDGMSPEDLSALRDHMDRSKRLEESLGKFLSLAGFAGGPYALP